MAREPRCKTVDWDWTEFTRDARVEAMTNAELGAWVRVLGAMAMTEHPGRMLAPAVERIVGEHIGLLALLDRDGDWLVHARTCRDHAQQTRRVKGTSAMKRAAANKRWHPNGIGAMHVHSASNATAMPPSLLPSVTPEPTSCPEPASPPSGPYALPSTRGQFWTPTDSDLSEFSAAYPGVDLPSAFAKMRAWLTTNRAKGKTLRGLPRFANNWLAKEQDRPHPNGHPNGHIEKLEDWEVPK